MNIKMLSTLQNNKQKPNKGQSTAVTTDDLILTHDLPIEINDISTLNNAKQKAVEIYTRINSVSERIKEAKEDAEDASNMDVGMFGKTSKKATATSKALVRTNEAIAEMNDLIQEAIVFTKSSIEYSTIMMQAMSRMVEHGFKNTNGEIVELNESGTEFAEIIMSQADEYTNRHLQLVELQEKQKQGLDIAKLQSDENDERLENQIKKLKKLSDQSDQEIEQLIHLKTAEVLKRSDEQDIIQQQKIIELDAEANTLKEMSDANDLRHDEEIQQLFKLTSKCQTSLDQLESQTKQITKQTEQLIHSKIAETLKHSDEQDSVLKNEIYELRALLTKQNEENSLRIIKEATQLKDLINSNKNEINELQKKNSNLPTIISSISLVLILGLGIAIFNGII